MTMQTFVQSFTPPRRAATAALATAAVLAGIGIFFDKDDREARREAIEQANANARLAHDPLYSVALDKVRRTGVVPAVFMSRINLDLDQLETEDKKRAFLKIVLPLIARENARIRDERDYLRDGADEVPEYIWEKYNVRPGDMKTLERRVDVIPASMVVAQAALESGWGTSRFAREANNLFGIRTYNPETPGLEPEKAEGFRVIKYADLGESVAHYMRNLNTHAAYLNFRKARQQMRRQGRDPDARHLTQRLTQYSEIPKTYGKLLRQIIDGENLEDFDGLRLLN